MTHSPQGVGAVSAAPITLPLSGITADPAIQQRVEMDPALIGEYAENIGDWIASAPVIIFAADGVYWLADGFHRLAACQAAGLDSIPAVVHQGGRRDALLYAASANAAHGKRRTNADKRRAVETLLNDDEWSQWSDRRIAEAAGVSNTFAGNLRRQLSTVDSRKVAAPAALPVESVEDDEPANPHAIDAEPTSPPADIRPIVIDASDSETLSEQQMPPPRRIGKDGKSRAAPVDLTAAQKAAKTKASNKAWEGKQYEIARQLRISSDRFGRDKVIAFLKERLTAMEKEGQS